MTVIVGPPQAGFPVQQVVNSPADMVALLSFSEAVNAIYQLGQADPMTTGSTGPTTQHAETQFFMPDGPPLITLTSSTGLPPLPPDQPPDTGNNGPTGGFGSFPGEQPTPSRLAFEIDKDVLSHDQQVQTGEGVNIGTPGDPFVNTAGSVFGAGNIVVTLEANPSGNNAGADSGLSVTGGGRIFLFTDGDQVVGRVSTDGTPQPQGATAFVVSITADGTTLSVEQLLPIDHSGADDILSIINDALLVRVTINDGTTSLSQTLPIGERVAFEDDEPVAADDPAQLQAQDVPVDVNALIILDTSGSMAGTRFDLAKAAILDFAAQSNVLSVQILPFASSAGARSPWFDVSTPEGREDLDDYLSGLFASGGTNYQDAIFDARNDWNAPPDNEAAITNIYFISDGAPSPGLTGNDLANWEAFLANPDNGIDNAYAIGIGTSVDNVDLREIAYPNEPDESNNVIIINSADDLRETLESTTFTGAASGNVLDNDSFGSDGQGLITTLRHDSDNNGVLNDQDVTYRFDGTDIYKGEVLETEGSELTFETSSGGSFTFNFETGVWNYTSPDTFAEPFVERFGYTIADGDHDVSGLAALSITVSPPGSDPIGFLLASTQNPPVD